MPSGDFNRRTPEMNQMQIKCFLALAQTQNFTKAAEQLYISQPGLSHQIVSLERELNTQLFVRNQKMVRLTPAAKLLAKELPELDRAYEDLIQRVQAVGRGHSGSLTIGTVEGQWVGGSFAELCCGFAQKYPNIDLQLRSGAFSDVRRWLSRGEVDVGLTLQFDISDVSDLRWMAYDNDYARFAVSRRLPLGQKEKITVEDVMEETLLLISPDDSRVGAALSREFIKASGMAPKNIRYAPNLSTIMLWIEAGLGVGIINHHSNIANNPMVRLIEEVELTEAGANACLAWKKDCLNPAVDLFVQMADDRKNMQSQ